MSTALTRRPDLTMFLAVSVLDMVSTWLGLTTGLAESNGLPALLLHSGGVAAMFGAKAGVTLLIAAAVVRLSPYYPRLWGALRFATYALYLVVWLNVIQAMAA